MQQSSGINVYFLRAASAIKSNCIDPIKSKCNRAKLGSESVPQVLSKNSSQAHVSKSMKRRFSHKHVQENHDYQSSVIGKEVAIECKIKNYTSDEKVWLFFLSKQKEEISRYYSFDEIKLISFSRLFGYECLKVKY